MKTLQSLALAVVLAFAVAAHADTSDFALFDGTNSDNLPDAGRSARPRAPTRITSRSPTGAPPARSGSATVTATSSDSPS